MGEVETANLVSDVSLVSLGKSDNRLLATNFDLAGLPAAIPQADVTSISSGTHFSMLPVCTPHGAAILAEENDDPVCTDPEGVDRAAIHTTVLSVISNKLGL